MDIFEYIDRVKANYSKQPEPRYNTKKYFMGGRVGFATAGLVETKPFFNQMTGKNHTQTEIKRIKKFGVEKYKKLNASQRLDIRQGSLGKNFMTEEKKIERDKRLRPVFKGKGSKLGDTPKVIDVSGPKELKKEYIDDFKKRLQYPTSGRKYKDAVRSGEILSNPKLAIKYKMTIGDVERLNSFFKKQKDLKYEKGIPASGQELRQRRLRLNQPGTYISGKGLLQFHHIMPIGGEVELTSKDVTFLNKYVNASMQKYNNPLNRIADGISDNLERYSSTKDNKFLKKIDDLNTQAAQIVDKATKELPKKYKGLIGFNKITPVLDENATLINTSVERIGIDEAKTPGGKKGAKVKLSQMPSGTYTPAKFNKEVKKAVNAVENLPEDIQIKICNRLSSGGLPGDCANAIKKDPMKTSQIIVNETKDLKTAAGARALKAGRTLLKFGVVGEGAFIGADAGIRIYMGRPKNEAFLAATFREGKADDLRKKRAGLTDREFLVDKATDLESKKDSLQQEIGAANSMGDYYNEKDIDVLQKRLDKTIAELQKPIDKTGTRLVDLLDPGSATNISYQRKMDNIMDLDKAKSSQSRGFLRDVQEGIPNIADYGEIDAGVTKRTFAPRKAAAPMSTMDDYANQFDDEYLEEVRTKYKNPNITKKDILRAYREDENFNKGIFKSIFEEGLSSNANRERLLGTSGKFASGGMARASFGIGGFTKAQFIIQRMKNSLKQAFGKTDPDSKYVNETFPNMIKELEAKPELGNNENVFKMFSEDLPKNQKVVVHSDDSIDFFTQSDFGPQNIEPTIKFAEENNISIKEASKILKMEPEDQVLEKTRLQILKDKGRTRQASGGLTSLTRTIPPERGPNSQGLASFMKNGKR